MSEKPDASDEGFQVTLQLGDNDSLGVLDLNSVKHSDLYHMSRAEAAEKLETEIRDYASESLGSRGLDEEEIEEILEQISVTEDSVAWFSGTVIIEKEDDGTCVLCSGDFPRVEGTSFEEFDLEDAQNLVEGALIQAGYDIGCDDEAVIIKNNIDE